jgi:hypothetical protein
VLTIPLPEGFLTGVIDVSPLVSGLQSPAVGNGLGAPGPDHSSVLYHIMAIGPLHQGIQVLVDLPGGVILFNLKAEKTIKSGIKMFHAYVFWR